MKRVTPKTLAERQTNKNKFTDLPKLKDILVDLSVKNTPKVKRKLRLIGPAVEFAEIQDKKRIPGEKNTERVPFPDAHKNGSPTRIGHDDDKLCPWRKMGYTYARRFAQRCIEEQEDGTWVHKILVKGPMVFDFFFDWEAGRREEAEGDTDVSTFLGGDVAPTVRIEANFDSSKLGNVDYTLACSAKDMVLTEEYINMLRAVREPSVDELNTYRAEYNEARESDPEMPEWRDYFEYGHDIRRIFKYTPPIEDSNDSESTSANTGNTSSAAENTVVEEDETENSTVVTSESTDSDLEVLTW
jgi:hypothetical protein